MLFQLGKLSSAINLIMQMPNGLQEAYLAQFSKILANKTHNDTHMYFLMEISLALIRDKRFADCEIFLKAFQGNNGLEPTEDLMWKPYNFCLLVFHVCQRSGASQSLFFEIIDEYLPEVQCSHRPDLNQVRLFVLENVREAFWPTPKSRQSAGGPPPDLMNMLQGLMGSGNGSFRR